MHTLGHNFMPAPIHAGGLRYHGISPLVSQAVNDGLASPIALPQLESYAAAIMWAKTEGFLVAPESSHAIAAAIREAYKAREEGKEKVILLNISGHGHMDLAGYSKYLNGELTDYSLPQEEIDRAEKELGGLPKI
jgi:tryptophan synthase beta chain